MAGESVVDTIKVTSEELLEVFALENAQLRIELHAQKIMSGKLKQALVDMENDNKNNS
jgi:hypothetical protein